jgi:hypothetical protein
MKRQMMVGNEEKGERKKCLRCLGKARRGNCRALNLWSRDNWEV